MAIYGYIYIGINPQVTLRYLLLLSTSGNRQSMPVYLQEACIPTGCLYAYRMPVHL